jgi:hypothetical protein
LVVVVERVSLVAQDGSSKIVATIRHLVTLRGPAAAAASTLYHDDDDDDDGMGGDNNETVLDSASSSTTTEQPIWNKQVDTVFQCATEDTTTKLG